MRAVESSKKMEELLTGATSNAPSQGAAVRHTDLLLDGPRAAPAEGGGGSGSIRPGKQASAPPLRVIPRQAKKPRLENVWQAKPAKTEGEPEAAPAQEAKGEQLEGLFAHYGSDADSDGSDSDLEQEDTDPVGEAAAKSGTDRTGGHASGSGSKPKAGPATVLPSPADLLRDAAPSGDGDAPSFFHHSQSGEDIDHREQARQPTALLSEEVAMVKGLPTLGRGNGTGMGSSGAGGRAKQLRRLS
ncbi:uncharacterized protein LOC142354824 [Convolutriloba macropyga]|uniref:uncharacterized protein LOC142354824 n=1 Tax=Convolutriloba macropyga TaxID=536237 RepID=UPI003F525D5F